MEFYISTSIHTVRLGHYSSGIESILQVQQPLLFLVGGGPRVPKKLFMYVINVYEIMFTRP